VSALLDISHCLSFDLLLNKSLSNEKNIINAKYNKIKETV